MAWVLCVFSHQFGLLSLGYLAMSSCGAADLPQLDGRGVSLIGLVRGTLTRGGPIKPPSVAGGSCQP